MKLIELVPLAIKLDDAFCTRSCEIIRSSNSCVESRDKLWFQLPNNILPPEYDDCDSYVLAILMTAMEENRDIVVKGKVSLELLRNLMEYQSAWNKWLPNKYSKIKIKVEAYRCEKSLNDNSICAFSGGVDASFSVWRHTQNSAEYIAQNLILCSIVHGFDIPLAEEHVFENAVNRAEKSLVGLSLELYSLKTNYREIIKTNWEHCVSCALVAALNNFKNVAGVCIVGSSEPYDALVIPWGSSPITDHLLSSLDFKIWHDGAAFNRTEKVKAISNWKDGIQNLRVCWQGELKDRNCGKCEKCVRTKLNFLAVGSSIPGCFEDDEDIIQSIKNVKHLSDLQRSEWTQLYKFAKQRGVTGNWLKLVLKKSKKKSLLELALPKGSARRILVKKLMK
jgi:hypothetical protein